MSLLRLLGDRCRDERGSALVISMIAMALMLMLGLATLALTDQQTRQSGVERVRESSFNLAEGALQQQGFLLGGKKWPKTAADELPLQCDQTSDPAVNSRCPLPSSLVTAAGTGAFDSNDYAIGTSWVTQVRDNVPVDPANPLAYRNYTAAVDSQPRWDSDGNGYIWTKSTATVGNRTRTLVALLKRDPIPILMPKAVLVAGSLAVGQSGQSPVITTDPTTPPVLRCEAGDACADYIESGGKKESQISPDTVSYNPSAPNLVPADTVKQLLESTDAFTYCPTEAQVAAQEIVVIDTPGLTCEFTGNTVYHSSTKPGIIIMRRGTLSFAGSGQFYGMILHLNEETRGPADRCVRIPGTFDIYGGVVVEGNCGMYIQGNARLTFSPNNLNFSVTGVAGLVQNTWRELPND